MRLKERDLFFGQQLLNCAREGQDAAPNSVAANYPANGADATPALMLRIREVLPVTPRTQLIRMELGALRFDYQPGQAVFVGRAGERAYPYSLTSPPEEAYRTGCLEILSRGEQFGGDLVGPASFVEVTGPVGQFTLPVEMHPRQRLVFIAGGTGIAPVRSILRRVVSLTDCDIEVLYSARAADEFPYESELQSMAKNGRIRLWQTVTRDSGNSTWTGARGRIDETTLEPFAVDPVSLFFICGPLSLVDSTREILTRLGVSADRVRTDRW
jgi:ferredoxin-NADP reductase